MSTGMSHANRGAGRKPARAQWFNPDVILMTLRADTERNPHVRTQPSH
jgi:hypothetical protein